MPKPFAALSAALLLALPCLPRAADSDIEFAYYTEEAAVPPMQGSFAAGALERNALDDIAALGTHVPATPGREQAGNAAAADVSPVPEPDSWALLCAGLAMLALRGGRRDPLQRAQKLG